MRSEETIKFNILHQFTLFYCFIELLTLFTSTLKMPDFSASLDYPDSMHPNCWQQYPKLISSSPRFAQHPCKLGPAAHLIPYSWTPAPSADLFPSRTSLKATSNPDLHSESLTATIRF